MSGGSMTYAGCTTLFSSRGSGLARAGPYIGYRRGAGAQLAGAAQPGPEGAQVWQPVPAKAPPRTTQIARVTRSLARQHMAGFLPNRSALDPFPVRTKWYTRHSPTPQLTRERRFGAERPSPTRPGEGCPPGTGSARQRCRRSLRAERQDANSPARRLGAGTWAPGSQLARGRRAAVVVPLGCRPPSLPP